MMFEKPEATAERRPSTSASTREPDAAVGRAWAIWFRNRERRASPRCGSTPSCASTSWSRGAHLGGRGGATRAGARESRHSRQLVDHAHDVLRPAAHPAGRGRAEPSSHAVRAALRRRRRWRLYRGRRRAHDDAPGRLHHHAVGHVARPRQSGRRSRDLDGRSRHSARRVCRCELRRALSGRCSRSHGRKATRRRATA